MTMSRFFGQLLCCFRPNQVPPSSPSPGTNGSSNIHTETDYFSKVSPPGNSVLVTFGLQLQGKYLLPQVRNSDVNKICLVIDLDETLVHSSFKVSPGPVLIRNLV